MKKKLLALVLVVVLGISSVVGGTLAYLTDTGSDVNVMTLGNVDIEQHEYQRATNDDGSYKTNTIDGKNSYVLEPFEQGKDLLPIVGDPSLPGDTAGYAGYDETIVRMTQVDSYGSMQVFAGKNAQDKFVTVENTGKTDAYVRTLVAIENGTGNASLIGVGTRCVPAEDAENSTAPWVSTYIGPITVDGNTYGLFEYVYRGASDVNRHVNGVLPAGDTTYPSLCQVYLKSSATNEDCEALDGNDNGTLDILVFSQAVQAQGFANAETALDAAFGDITTTNHPWVDGVEIPVLPVGYEVSSDAELAAAVAAGETEIWLNAGTYHAPAAAKGKTLTINGTKDAVLEVVPAGQGEANGQLDYSFDGSTVTFNGITIKTNSQLYAGYARLSGTYNDCVIQNTYNLGTGNSAFYNCEINITNEYLRVGGAYSAIFDGCTFNTDGRAILVFQDGTSVAQTVTVKDCTFNATAAAKTWNGIHIAAVSIDGTNGTYVVNLEGNNTVDSDFNGLWQIKAGEANVTVNE